MEIKTFGVWLHNQQVGILSQKGDYTQFSFLESYIDDPNRSVLGLRFEEEGLASASSKIRLPSWFSNLLPEGRLRDWIAEDRGVSVVREAELLAQVGADLPGAVRVLPTSEDNPKWPISTEAESAEVTTQDLDAPIWKFSLAGVAIKFSMLQRGDRLTLPAYGQGGDWIVKLPDPTYTNVPLNEFSMMTLAERVGINTPEHILVHRDELSGIPDSAWRSTEPIAYAVKRFDRNEDRSLVHIEDFAQVRGIYPYDGQKYQGNFETVASLAYRQRFTEDLEEVVRRLVLNILIGNGDAHLKNWSLIYSDAKVPRLSPVYDVVSTIVYSSTPQDEDLGLKFGGTKNFSKIRVSDFERLGNRLRVPHLSDIAIDTVKKIKDHWPDVSETFKECQSMRNTIDNWINQRSKQFLQ